MTIRERRRRRLIKRLFAVGGVTFAILAATNRQEAAETTFTRMIEMPTVSPKATIKPTEPPQRGKELGRSKCDEYRAARMAMAEAEGEDIEGKALVILVIYNRIRSRKFPDTVMGVISQENAFTSYHNGRYEKVEPDIDCWAALDLIQETGWDESQGALYFERTPEDGESTWHSRNLERLFSHDNHTFYKEKEARDS